MEIENGCKKLKSPIFALMISNICITYFKFSLLTHFLDVTIKT